MRLIHYVELPYVVEMQIRGTEKRAMIGSLCSPSERSSNQSLVSLKMKMQGNLSYNILDNHQIYFFSLYVNRLFLSALSQRLMLLYSFPDCFIIGWLVGLLRRRSLSTNSCES